LNNITGLYVLDDILYVEVIACYIYIVYISCFNQLKTISIPTDKPMQDNYIFHNAILHNVSATYVAIFREVQQVS